MEAAARDLYVHPNTVRYRLKRIQEVTGYNPADPREAYILRMAITLGLGAITSWGMREWYTLTFIMGAVFIAGQLAEYITLIGEGHTISSSVYFSAFFIATGFHGLHVTGGLVLFLFTLARTYMARRFTHEQAVTAMVVSYYWHFVDVVWIILFSVIYIVS